MKTLEKNISLEFYILICDCQKYEIGYVLMTLANENPPVGERKHKVGRHAALEALTDEWQRGKRE
jgi:hypothetical protein